MSLLIDSSVWIDYFNGIITPQTDHLHKSAGRDPIIVGDLILAEVLQGFRSDADFEKAKGILLKFPILTMVNTAVAIKSASNYRILRKQGVTIRKTIDCFIATSCIENQLMLLHTDRDFNHFETHLGLQVFHP